VSDLDELRRLAAPGMSLPVHVVVDNGPDSWGVRLCIPDGSTVARFGAGQKADAEYVAAVLNRAATSDRAPLDAETLSVAELRAIIEDAAQSIETAPGGAVPWLAQSLRDFLADPAAWRRVSGFVSQITALREDGVEPRVTGREPQP
jgi:hypothetical protein